MRAKVRHHQRTRSRFDIHLDAALASEKPGTRPQDAYQEAMSTDDAKFITDCTHDIEMYETEEALGVIGQIVAGKNVVIREAVREAYRTKLIELRKGK